MYERERERERLQESVSLHISKCKYNFESVLMCVSVCVLACWVIQINEPANEHISLYTQMHASMLLFSLVYTEPFLLVVFLAV